MHEPEKLMSTNLFPLAKNDFDSYQYDLRSVLLADGIPATSFAMGANTISAMKNIDMAELEGAGWPRKDKEWHHSDIKNVAYYYEKRFFDKLVKGEDK